MTSNTKLVVDESRWPIIVVRLPPGVTPAESWIKIVESAIARAKREDKPFALVFDVREAGDLPSKERAILSQYLKENYEELQRWFVCHPMIETSVIHRAAMTTIMWLLGSKMPFRVKAFSQPEDGIRWAETSLRTFTEAARVTAAAGGTRHGR